MWQGVAQSWHDSVQNWASLEAHVVFYKRPEGVKPERRCMNVSPCNGGSTAFACFAAWRSASPGTIIFPAEVGRNLPVVASSGPDPKDLWGVSGQPELRRGADSPGAGEMRRKSQPVRGAACHEKGRAAESAAHRPTAWWERTPYRKRRKTWFAGNLSWRHPIKNADRYHQISCEKGKLYIFAILDCCNGGMVDLALSYNMKKDLCVRDVESACRFRDVRHAAQRQDSQSPAQRLERHWPDMMSSREWVAWTAATTTLGGRAFFTALKKKLYQIPTEELPMDKVKGTVFLHITTYHNRERIYTVNQDGFAPAMYQQAIRGMTA